MGYDPFEENRPDAKDDRIAELEHQLTYAKMAIKSAVTHFGIEESGVAEILSYVNGYEDSPDLHIDNMIMPDGPRSVLDTLWNSTDSLHRTFDMFPPDPEKTLMVFAEEHQEFGDAVAEMIADAEFNPGSSDVVHEAADVIVTILGTLTALGIAREDFYAACRAVAAKNLSKTHETHYVREDGKISRRSK